MKSQIEDYINTMSLKKKISTVTFEFGKKHETPVMFIWVVEE